MADGNDSLFDGVERMSGHPGEPQGEGSLQPGGPEGNLPEPPSEEKKPAETETGEDAEIGEEAEVEDTTETVGQDCDHGWYPEITAGLGVLSLLLIVAVVLLAIRSRNLKRRIRRRKPSATERPAAGAAAPLEAPATIQVGKLHQIGDRESQQDCLAVSPTELYDARGVLAVVADGMGGLSDGDKMSQTAASAMMNGFMNCREYSPELILALTVEANQAVNRVLGPNQGRSGTTLVAGIVKDGLFNYVSVGDSRICLYRQGLLTQLNREHIYRNELRTQAVNGLGTLWDAGTHPKAAGLTSYLGMGSLKYLDIPAEPLRVCRGDKIILMSDGVYNAMTLPELEGALALPAQQAADAIGQTIHAKAYRNQDNYTAVILQF